MKKIFLFLLLFSCGMTLAGQTSDTTFISISQEDAPLERQRLLDRYDEVFSSLEPTRWLFKLNLLAFSGTNNDVVRASAEVKVVPAISLHGSYGFGYGQSLTNEFTFWNTLVSHRLGLEPRWYYAMPRRIRQGKSANNMSGSYLGLEAVYIRAKFGPRQFGEPAVFEKQRSLALRYGLQRRLFRYGFLDIGFGIGILQKRRSDAPALAQNTWTPFANSQIGLGLALARPKTTSTVGGYCDVLRCFREERQMWKIDLYNLIRVNDLDNYRGLLSIAYERKLGRLPLSLEVQGEWSARHFYDLYNSGANPHEYTGNSNTYGGSLQSRYYYTQRRRIAKGKSGNNLSGLYVGAQFRWVEGRGGSQGYQCGVVGCFSTDDRGTNQSTGGGLLCGIQHRLFKHGFIDCQVVGSQEWVQSEYTQIHLGRTFTTNSTEENFNLALKLRAGLAF